jgi:hypothetical protein
MAHGVPCSSIVRVAIGFRLARLHREQPLQEDHASPFSNTSNVAMRPGSFGPESVVKFNQAARPCSTGKVTLTEDNA